MKQLQPRRRGALGDFLAQSAVYAAGGAVLTIILAIGYFLFHDAGYAFDRKFDMGFRFGLQSKNPSEDEKVEFNPYASLLTLNREGSDEIEPKEEDMPMPTLDTLATSEPKSKFGTGSPQATKLDEIDPLLTFRDHWRGMRRADEGQKFYLLAFATPEHTDDTMFLAWTPDNAYDAEASPYDLKLRLVRGPEGVAAPNVEIDLRKQPSGRVELPTYVAKTDEDRFKGYVFELEAKPTMSHPAAVMSGVARTSWDPTLAYPRFGFVPLLIGTLLITGLSVLFATPLAVGTAVYVSELAPRRIREWLKPTIELLASVPTVVLGFFGLMLIAPAMQHTLAAALGLESGRALLTTAIVMAVLLIPTITTIAEDALRAVPTPLRDGGEALGLTVAETLKKIVLPSAKGGIVAALLLGVARAIGETMIVWILSGGTPLMPSFNGAKDTVANLMRPARGVPDTVAIEMGNVDVGGVHYGHLFLLGLVLFLITLGINILGFRYARRAAWRS